MNTLIYVERDLILPIAARLVGTSVSTGMTEDVRAGLNWIVAASAGYGEETAAEVKMSELFPEDIFNYCYPHIQNRRLQVRSFCDKVSKRSMMPPDVATVTGVLRIPGMQQVQYNPFDPPDIELPKVYRVYGYRTFLARLDGGDGFSIPVYIFADSAPQAYYAIDKPIELVGVVKWSPGYEVGGYNVNCILLCAAILLNR